MWVKRSENEVIFFRLHGWRTRLTIFIRQAGEEGLYTMMKSYLLRKGYILATE